MIRTVRLVTRPARYLAGLVLPHQCVLCMCFADSTGLCAACWSGLAPIGVLVCERCSLPLGHALAEPICAACWMDPPPLAMMMDGEDGLVVPVPLQRQRYSRRRYNQSAELARRLCRITARGSLATDILVRHRATATQGGLSRRQRHRNIAEAFSVRQDECTRLAGRPVVLVDDVMTTGATLFTAAKCLSAAGSGLVSALVVARLARPREP